MDEKLVHKVLTFRWFVFGILAVAYLFVYFHRLSMSVVAQDIAKDFQASASVLGLLGSIYFYCYALMQFPAGLLSDSIGPRKTVTFSLLIAAVGSILFGLAPSIKIAFVARILVGLGVSLVFIPTMKILSQWFKHREFAPMSGILNAIGGLGVLAGTGILGILATKIGWRLSFEIIGGCTILLIVMVWLLVRDNPAERGWPTIAQIENKAENISSPSMKIGLLAGAKQVVCEKYFWPLAFWFFFDCGIFFGFGGLWAGPYLMHSYGITKGQAGAILSMIAWGMVIGGPFLGYLSEKVLKSRKKTLILCSALLAMLQLFLYIYPTGLSFKVLYIWFFLFSVFSSASVVVGFTAVKELFPVEIAGTSVGTVNFFPFLGGAVFMPLLGRVLDAHPKLVTLEYSPDAYRIVLLILFFSAIASLGCAFVMKETYRH